MDRGRPVGAVGKLNQALHAQKLLAVIARQPDYLGYIRQALTPAAIADWYKHFLPDDRQARIDLYEVPGIDALNFVVNDSMAGGINKSPRLDSGAKGMAQQLLEFPVPVPEAVAAKVTAKAA